MFRVTQTGVPRGFPWNCWLMVRKEGYAYMPRRDRTYSGADVVRFWMKNLTEEEREAVWCFFVILADAKRGGGFTRRLLVEVIGSVGGLIPIAGDILEFLLELIQFFDELAEVRVCRRKAMEIFRSLNIPVPEFPS